MDAQQAVLAAAAPISMQQAKAQAQQGRRLPVVSDAAHRFSDLVSEAEEEEDEDEEGDVDLEGEGVPTGGVPPGLKQVQAPRRKKRRANRVSVCTARCRSSIFVVSQAIERLQWEQVARDTPEVSVAWLEHTDSTAMICPFQVTSKIDGILQVCRKADLAACLQQMLRRYPRDYSFVPPTWILSGNLPDQTADLERTMMEKKGWTYICKPTAGSQGRGLRLVKSFGELRGPIRDALPRGSERLRPAEYVVQRYVSKPLLVDGFKFDCRCYVIVTGVVPLRGYLFREGLARFCTAKYEKPRSRNLHNTCMHLTNYAVNKRSDAFSTARAHDEGSKRSLSSVFDLIEAEGGPSAEEMWGSIRELAEKTLLALRPALVEHLLHSHCVAQSHLSGGTGGSGKGCALHPAGPKGFHILGFDVLFDEKYRPSLLELNANSSMSAMQPAQDPSEGGPKTEVSELDLAVKAELISQALLCANPLPHGKALRRRIAWFEEMSAGCGRSRLTVCPTTDEPIPLDDDGNPIHEGISMAPMRPDQPRLCPALQELDFTNHAAYAYVRAHVGAYRIWRHFAFNPPGSYSLKETTLSRRYMGFGRPQFRLLCDAAGLVAMPSAVAGASSSTSSSCGRLSTSSAVAALQHGPACWPDRIAAELFLTGALSRSGDALSQDPSGGTSSAAGSAGGQMDFQTFFRRVVFPVGEALAEGRGDPVESFVQRVLPCIVREAAATAGAAAVAASASSTSACRMSLGGGGVEDD